MSAADIKTKRDEPAFYDCLDSTLDYCWRLFQAGVTDRQCAFHMPTLATVRPDGTPSIRTVVLRSVDPDRRQLRFHTDIRSSKVGEITEQPRVAVHFYDAKSKVQLRIDGTASLHHDDAAAAKAWRGTRPLSRQCYRVEQNPGTAIADPTEAFAPSDWQDDEAGRSNFAAVTISFDALEWLYLSAHGHRRAQFTWHDGDMRATWLVP
ncbi:MAG: pyridoxamine 5'-phosphate oxidase [Alphaproteobacteria bacterium]|nr:pyridoxamine 5'-phosphate oxidase [Alphaproteobacteria bacterium]